MAILHSRIYSNPKLFLNETNGLAKASFNVMVMVEDAVVAEGPPNTRKRSSTFRYGDFVNLASRFTTVSYAGGGECKIAWYTGGGDRIRGVDDGDGEYAGEHVGEDEDED